MKYKRDRRGKFVSDKMLTKIFLVTVFLGAVSMIGWNTIVNTIGATFEVENAKAVEPITNEVIAEARIEYLISRIYNIAKVYGISGYQMERTIECESRFNNIQSSAYKNGIREDSWGIAQIHLPSWPEVSREEALDEEFAIDWMASHWNKAVWYGYSRKYDRCN